MPCPKCNAAVPAGAVECPRCGVVVEKYAEAADRAFLHRRTMSKPKPMVVEKPKKSNRLLVSIIVLIVAIVGLGAWRWYSNDSKQSDLAQLAAETSQDQRPESGGNRGTNRLMLRLLVKLGVAVVVFAAGYIRLKESLSP